MPIILAVTANAFTEEQEKYISAGMDGVLTKPLRLGELKTALDKCIQELPGRREIAQYSSTRIPTIATVSSASVASFTIPAAPALPSDMDATQPLPIEKRRRIDVPHD